jgi:hypothetical protein
LNRNSECIPRSLAAGVTSESDKINILTSGDSSRLEVYAYLPRGVNLNEKPSKAASKKQQLGHLIPAALFVKNIAR